jgi:hypothetical protein
MSRDVELAEVIQHLRQELTRAMQQSEGEDLRFQLGPVELAVDVVVERSGDASGGVRFWVVDAHADGRLASSLTQRIRLVLDPRRTDRPGERVVIAGAEVSGER